MDNDKNSDFGETLGTKESEFSGENSTRARNRTVMLTPEITGQVRARLAQEMEGGSGFTPPNPTQSEFTTPRSAPPGSTYAPAGRSSGPTDPAIPAPSTASGGYGGASAPRQAPPPVADHRPRNANGGVIWSKLSPIIGFLVSFDKNENGDVYELRSGRLIITREDSGAGNYLLIEDETVSPMHAIMRISASGDVQVLDQLSEYGTKVRHFGSEEQKELSGEKCSLEHGDVITFGKCSFHVCLLAKGE